MLFTAFYEVLAESAGIACDAWRNNSPDISKSR